GRGKHWVPWLLIPLAAAATLAVVLLGRRGWGDRRGTWEVVRVAGLPLVGSSPLGATGALQVGQWLETDDSSRAVILVGDIGHVGLDGGGRRSVVPLGFRADTRRAFGPGTPYAEDAPEALRQALAAFDFANGGPAAVRRALAAARSEDAVSLWHLLERVDPALRRAVYDRLASLVPPPAGVTSEGALRLDRTTLDTYWNTIRRIAWRRIILRGV